MNREYVESVCISVYHEQRRRERAAERLRRQRRRQALVTAIKLLGMWLGCAAAVTTLMLTGRGIESVVLRWVIYISFTVVLVYACCGLERQIKKAPHETTIRERGRCK